MPARPAAADVDPTAFWTAYCRAIESRRDDALFVDRFAAALCGGQGRAIGRALERRAPVASAVAIRTRVIDDRLRRSLANDRVERVALLGCGLDARPLRLEAPPDVEWIELDRAPVLAWKAHRLGPCARVAVRRIAVDLADRDDVGRALATIPGRLVVVLEGVVQYLDRAAVDALLGLLARRGAWTRLLCDVGGGRWSRWFAGAVRRTAASAGSPYRTQLDDPLRLLAARGWTSLDTVSLAEWDAARPAPRWRRPWTARWIAGYADAARVIDAVSTG